MNLSPTPNLNGTLVGLSNGYAGVVATLATMRALVNEYKTNVKLRQIATQIIFLTPEKDEFSEADALFAFVRDTIRYVKDVHGVETLATPIITLATKIGDCDDQTTLLATLLESVGYPTRFVIAAYHVSDEFEHVYLQACVAGEWLDMDATEQQALGWSPPDPVSVQIENVECF
jgi:transglutaminase-like putative cysteine protease